MPDTTLPKAHQDREDVYVLGQMAYLNPRLSTMSIHYLNCGWSVERHFVWGYSHIVSWGADRITLEMLHFKTTIQSTAREGPFYRISDAVS